MGSVDGIELVLGGKYVELTEEQAARLKQPASSCDIEPEEEQE